MVRLRILVAAALVVGAVTGATGALPAGPFRAVGSLRPAGATVTKVTEPVSSFGWLTVDTDRLFVSAPTEGKVLVTDLAGAVQHTITGESGATQVALDGGALLVLRPSSGGGGSLDVLDASTFAVDTQFAFASTFVASEVALVGTHAWVGGSTTGGGAVLDDIDIPNATQTMRTISGIGSCDVLVARPQVAGQLVCASATAATPLAEIDTTGSPTVAAEITVAGGTFDVAVTPSGSILLAADATGSVVELSGSDLHTVSTFAVSRFADAPAHLLDVTAAGGGRFVAAGSVPGLQEFDLGRPGGPVGADLFDWVTRPHGLRFSLAGDTLYRFASYPNSGVVLEISTGATPVSAPPTPIFTEVPQKLNSDAARFAWQIGGSGIRLCSYDGAPFERCSSPYAIENPTVGDHTFSVRTERAVGTDSPIVSYRWHEGGYVGLVLAGYVAPGTEHVGVRGATGTAIVENLTDRPVTIVSIVFTGTNPFDFDGTTNCGAVLAGHAECRVRFWPRPLEPGVRKAAITVTTDAVNPTASLPVSTTGTEGYYLADARGLVEYGGDAGFYGDLFGKPLASPIIDMAVVPPGTQGYWLLGADGGIFTFGHARFFGSTGAMHLNRPIVAMAPTPSGNGYWLVASDGGIFSFGDAKFYGSTGAIRLNRPIVGIAPTRTGRGYWLVASDGGIFAFGDARFYGSTGALRLAQPIIGISPTPSGRGYWFVASDGGVFAFGDAVFHGSLASETLTAPVTDFESTPTGFGYWMVQRDGAVWGFADAALYGSAFGDPAAIVPFASDVTSLALPGPSSTATGRLRAVSAAIVPARAPARRGVTRVVAPLETGPGFDGP